MLDRAWTDKVRLVVIAVYSPSVVAMTNLNDLGRHLHQDHSYSSETPSPARRLPFLDSRDRRLVNNRNGHVRRMSTGSISSGRAAWVRQLSRADAWCQQLIDSCVHFARGVAEGREGILQPNCASVHTSMMRRENSIVLGCTFKSPPARILNVLESVGTRPTSLW